MKGLEAIISLRNRLVEKGIKDQFLEELIAIEKELKALEIIRNIGILLPYETIGGKCWLETMSDATKITKDNYELLKEVLL